MTLHSIKQQLSGSILLILLLIFPGSAVCAATGTMMESTIDTLERQLEMERHQKLTAIKTEKQSTLTAFTTDGCSGGLSIGWEYLAGKIQTFQATHGTLPPWQSCCVTHDKAYHEAGGREATALQSFAARKAADQTLKNCVLATGIRRSPELSLEYNLSSREIELLYSTIAALMYRAVRIGGMPCTGLPWRWGYGWPDCAQK